MGERSPQEPIWSVDPLVTPGNTKVTRLTRLPESGVKGKLFRDPKLKHLLRFYRRRWGRR